MSVIRSYNQSNGVAITDAPAQVVRLFDRGVLVVGGGGGGAVDSVNGETGTVVLSAVDVGAQPVDSDLTSIAALSTAAFGRSLLTQADAATARTTLGAGTSSFDGVYASLTGKPTLGTAAASATGDFDAAGAAASAQAASQPLDSDLTAIAALTTTSFGRALLALADAAALRTAGGLGTAAVAATGDFDAAGAAAAAQAASQPLDSDLTAIAALSTTSYGRAFLALADAAAGRITLGLGTAATSASTDFQPIDSDLTAVAALTTTSYGRALLELANQAALMALLAASSTTASGIVELATTAETQTGTDAVRAVTPAGGAATYQPLDSDLTSIAALSTTSYGRAFLALANTAALMALLTAADTTTQGIVELATSAETTTGTDTTRATTPAGVKAVSDLLAPLASPALTGNPTAPTASAGDNDTSIATTAFVTAALTKQAEVFVFALGDETTAITTGTAKVTWRVPFAFTVTAVRASLTTASSSGIPTVDINEGGTTILSTKLTIDASELTSTTAATAAVISDSSLADDAEITFDIDVAGTGAKGLKVAIFGTRT